MKNVISGAPDRYVRVPRSLLNTVQINHLISNVDLTIAVPDGIGADVPNDVITGYTEWGGEWHSRAMSVGWDWGVVHGLIIMFNPAEIRTDIQLTDEGYDIPPRLNRIHLFEWIETLPWREYGIPQLLAEFTRSETPAVNAWRQPKG